MNRKFPARVPLRPCFACGGPPQPSVEFGPAVAEGAIACQRCGARTPQGLTYDQAWQEWNAYAEQPASKIDE
ncbi:MAG TPA: hypothetical protein VEG34_06965 [Thermoanaerobaculia bacterium]|nr:hypothetical protein [Thermoanaerobaculia bacterium]